MIEMSVLSDRAQADGRRYIRFCFAWKNGSVEQEFLLPANYSIDENRSVLISNISEMLEQKEINNLPELIKAGKSVSDILSGLEFITTKQAVTKAIEFSATESDLNLLANTGPVYDYLTTEYLFSDLVKFTGLQKEYVSNALDRVSLAIAAKKYINQIEGLRTND
jgi:hypothetical protein